MRAWIIALALSGCSFSVPSTFTPGDATDAPRGDGPDAPGDGSTGACKAVEVSAMSAHTCARMQNGDVWCWGINGWGEVGRPSQVTPCYNGKACNPTPEKLPMPAASRLGVGEEHGCALVGTDVYCWGRNEKNQFGDGTQANSGAPTPIASRTGATQIVGGLEHGCSLHPGGGVKCSGTNALGEVGDNSMMPRPLPVQTVPNGTTVIATGYQHACAVQAGFVYCWGGNFSGQVTTTVGGPVRSPAIVAGTSNVVAVAGGYGHTCAVRSGVGDVVCWGTNDQGQLGVGDTLSHYGAVQAAQFTGGIEVSAGSDHSCARTPAGNVFCWGEYYGSTPVQLALPRPAVSIASGSYHDCAALDDGSVWCRGWNAYGQLGIGTHDSGTTLVVSKVQLCP